MYYWTKVTKSTPGAFKFWPDVTRDCSNYISFFFGSVVLYKQCPVLNPWYLLYLKQTANQYEDWGGPYFTQYQFCDFGGRDWGKHPK